MFHVKHHSGSDLGGSVTLAARLDAYHDLVRKYHRTLDLVSDAALDRFEELIGQARMYAEAIDRVAGSGPVLDVGSGVGLPGLVVAAALPHRAVVLVERRRRRATFLKIAVAQLDLSNAVVTEADVRAVPRSILATSVSAIGSADASREAGADGFAVVTAQAVAGLSDVYCLTRHLHADMLTLIARKGPSWRDEVDAVRDRIGATPAVRAEIPLPDSGTLVAIDVPGGLPCPPSG